MKKNLISLGITAVIGFVWYYLLLPPINIHSFDFWIFVFILVGIFSIISSFSKLNRISNIVSFSKGITIPFIGIISVMTIIGVGNMILSPVFQSNKYANRIEINETGVFTSDVKQVDFNALPLLDKDSSSKLGDRVMGQMPEMVSQFYVASNYTQINYISSLFTANLFLVSWK